MNGVEQPFLVAVEGIVCVCVCVCVCGGGGGGVHAINRSSHLFIIILVDCFYTYSAVQ